MHGIMGPRLPGDGPIDIHLFQGRTDRVVGSIVRTKKGLSGFTMNNLMPWMNSSLVRSKAASVAADQANRRIAAVVLPLGT